MPTHGEVQAEPRQVIAMPRMSWGAILGGVAIAFAVEIMIALLGAGIGLGLVAPIGAQGPDASGLGLGALLWWGFGTILALALGTFVAVRAAGIRRSPEGAAHGLAIWAVGLLVSLYLLGSAVSGLVGGVLNAAGGVLHAAGASVQAAAPTIAQTVGLDQTVIDARAQALLAPAPADPAQMTPEAATKAVVAALPDALKGGADGQQAENRIADIVAAQTHESHDAALQRVEQTRQTLLNAKDAAVKTVQETARASAHVAAHAALLGFVVMVLAAMVASLSGSLAARRNRVLG
ncbi:hypothetical protein [Acidisoma sp. 7E03]